MVITDEPNMVTDVLDLGPFTGSDHEALVWQLEVRTKLEPVTKHILDYVKADIQSMKQELESINWANLLGNLSADESWNVFKNKLENLEQQFIPVKRLKQKIFKPVWMTHAAYKAVRQRRQVYSKCKNTSNTLGVSV